jgi:electron transfer flavoprotein alpha subunit
MPTLSPRISHTAKQTAEQIITNGTNTPATLSATFATGALLPAASLTIATIFDITVLSLTTAEEIADNISKIKPNAVLWGSDSLSKKLSAEVAALLSLGLCADCTRLQTDGNELYMYRPALSGSVIAKIISRTKPAMATVRTTKAGSDIMIAAGYGAKDSLDTVRAFADKYSAEIVTTRKAVDNDILPYVMQVGLTGKTVSPPVYIAVGVSGAVHHIAGMGKSGTIIAINPDKDAPIFDYADYGILATAEKLK